MQELSFSRFNAKFSFSVNAGPLLSPFKSKFLLFGKCRAAPFPVLAQISHFRAKQGHSFSRFNANSSITVNAASPTGNISVATFHGLLL